MSTWRRNPSTTPYTFVAAQTGLDEKTVRDIFNARAEFLGRWHRFEMPRILGIDELYLNKRYRCILTNIEERTLLDLLATRRQDVVTNDLMKLIQDGHARHQRLHGVHQPTGQGQEP